MLTASFSKKITRQPAGSAMENGLTVWQRKVSQSIALALSVAAIVLYYYSILRFTVNFPYSDDYTAVLDFLLRFRERSGNGWEQFRMIFAQHNEHRIIVCRLAVLAQYYLLGHVNFYWLTIIGNLGLLLVWCSIYWSIHRKSWFNHWLMVPVSYFLFQFQYIEISFFSMAALSGIWVLGLAAFTLAMLANTTSRVHFGTALMLAAICSFSQGNGWLVFPAGLIVLWNIHSGSSKRIIWIVSGILLLAAYLWNYHAPVHLMEKPDYFSLAFYWKCLLFFFSFMGGGLWLHDWWRVPAGIIVTGLWIWASFFSKKQPSAFFTGFGIFIILSVAMATMGRAALGFAFAEASRYQVNMAIFDGLVFLAFFLAIGWRKRIPSTAVFCLLAIGLCTLSYLYILRRKLYEEPRVKLLSQQAHRNTLPPDFHYNWGLPDKAYPKQILQKSKTVGIYNIKDF